MILVIDNYDSFTYNLVQMVGKMSPNIRVIRNQDMPVDEISALKPRGIILSPGPGRPEDAGITVEVVKKLGASIPILGVCLGHQSIGYAFGAKIIQARLFYGLFRVLLSEDVTTRLLFQMKIFPTNLKFLPVQATESLWV